MVTKGQGGAVSRRSVLAGLSAALALALAAGPVRPARARARAAPRIAAIDWAMAETALALGHAPVAVAELLSFRRVAPEAPAAATLDLGLRGAPNLEALSLAAPDLVLSSGYYAFAEPQLARIAPVFSRPLYDRGTPPLPRLVALLADLAAALGDPAAAGPVLRAARAQWAALAARAAPFAATPCPLLEICDARHVRLFGADSLFAGALAALGLAEATGQASRFAFAAPVPVEDLAAFPEARLVVVGEVPPQAARALDRGALWQSLPPVRAGRVLHLPRMNGFGGLPSALHFGHALLAALEGQG